MSIRKKQAVTEDVLTLARRRIEHIFDRFDHVAVSFSGGKDSTVCLNLALEEARKRGRLPLDVVHWDEEAIQPETVDYVRRVGQQPGIALRWLCLPIRHRNACSRKQPWWNPWNPAEKDIWCRPLPPEAITELPGLKPFHTIPQCNDLLYPESLGTVCVIMGVRADESLSRYRAIASKAVDSYLAPAYHYPATEDQKSIRHSKHVTLAKPIYDWTSEDVWTAPHVFGWDYNRAYDVMFKAGISLNQQRVAPPFGEEPLCGLWMYSVCWPDLWHKMTGRVRGAATAGRYARTELYSFGTHLEQPPPGKTWQEHVRTKLALFGPKERVQVAKRIKDMIERHNAKTNFEPLQDAAPNPTTGLSWKFIAMIANRGDLKNRKIPDTELTKLKGKKNGTRGIEAEQGDTRAV